MLAARFVRHPAQYVPRAPSKVSKRSRPVNWSTQLPRPCAADARVPGTSRQEKNTSSTHRGDAVDARDHARVRDQRAPPQATTLEVTVSKIFPAGAGWQAASLYADKLGFAADSASFALTTGVGDGIAVAAGHTGYYAVKKAVADPTIDMGEQAGVGVWLGSAAVCSGALWQPLVNALQASEKLPFEAVAGMTAVGCGGAFLTGLRVGRAVMPWVPDCDSANFATDAYLSMAIGGASSFFVGTDVAYLGGEGNFLRPIVGVEDLDSDLLGVAKAGTSTALGFVAFQSVQNVAFKNGTAWLDPAEGPEPVKEALPADPQASFS